VSFATCFERFVSQGSIEKWNCPQCKKPTTALKSTKIKTFPDVLITHMQRFSFDAWVPRKLKVDVVVPPEISLESVRATGLQPDEREFDAAAAPEPSADAGMVSQLMAMGFGSNRCVRALLAVKNSSVDAAMNYVFSTMDDPSQDDPLPAKKAAAAPSSGPEAPPELVAQLMSMGFDAARCAYALSKTSNDPDRAMDWLLSHMDDPLPSAAPGGAAAAPGGGGGDAKDGGPLNYRLCGIVTHLGKATTSGHYVAHLLKEGRWLLYNDEKVSLCRNLAALTQGYIYFFRRVSK